MTDINVQGMYVHKGREVIEKCEEILVLTV
jgi:hypothetical protein